MDRTDEWLLLSETTTTFPGTGHVCMYIHTFVCTGARRRTHVYTLTTSVQVSEHTVIHTHALANLKCTFTTT
jgi:hypothetical protein